MVEEAHLCIDINTLSVHRIFLKTYLSSLDASEWSVSPLSNVFCPLEVLGRLYKAFVFARLIFCHAPRREGLLKACRGGALVDLRDILDANGQFLGAIYPNIRFQIAKGAGLRNNIALCAIEAIAKTTRL